MFVGFTSRYIQNERKRPSEPHRIYEFEDTKGVIKIRKSKDRQHNGQKKK
jgi:hypothetical protein